LPTKNWFENAEISTKLFELGILNFVILCNDSKAFRYNYFSQEKFELRSLNLNQDFPDNLKNLHGYSYRILLYYDMPSFQVIDGKIQGSLIYFMEEMIRHQNATYNVTKTMTLLESTLANIAEYLYKKEFDFCPNTRVMSFDVVTDRKPIETLTTNSYCALIPKEDKKSFLTFMLSPFDLASWLLMIVSIIAGTLMYVFLNSIKKTGNTLSTGSRFLFATYGTFLGQGSNLFMKCQRKNLYFQHFIFFAFFLGSIYQSLIISFIFLDRDVQTIKSFQDLKESELLIYTDKYFKFLLEMDETSKNIWKRLNEVEFITYEFVDNLNETSTLVINCEIVDTILNNNLRAALNFFKLNQPIYSYYNPFFTRESNPFANRIQEYVFRFFESGLLNQYKIFFDRISKTENIQVKAYLESVSNQQNFLNFNDLFKTTIILLIGYSIATFVFALECITFRIKKIRNR
jgi:hypothetical protein